jgi:hypothetical protein
MAVTSGYPLLKDIPLQHTLNCTNQPQSTSYKTNFQDDLSWIVVILIGHTLATGVANLQGFRGTGDQANQARLAVASKRCVTWWWLGELHLASVSNYMLHFVVRA